MVAAGGELLKSRCEAARAGPRLRDDATWQRSMRKGAGPRPGTGGAADAISRLRFASLRATRRISASDLGGTDSVIRAAHPGSWQAVRKFEQRAVVKDGV